MKTKPFQEGVDESALLIESLLIENVPAINATASSRHPAPRHFRSKLATFRPSEMSFSSTLRRLCTKPLARRTLRVMSLGCWSPNELARCCDTSYHLIAACPIASFLETQRQDLSA